MMASNIQCVDQGYQQNTLIRRLLLIVLLLSLALPDHAADKGMLYVKFRLIAKEIKRGSFAGKPEKVWLIDHRYLSYQQNLKPDMVLFQLPQGVAISDSKIEIQIKQGLIQIKNPKQESGRMRAYSQMGYSARARYAGRIPIQHAD